jgi:hypothetical protein
MSGATVIMVKFFASLLLRMMVSGLSTLER